MLCPKFGIRFSDVMMRRQLFVALFVACLKLHCCSDSAADFENLHEDPPPLVETPPLGSERKAACPNAAYCGYVELKAHGGCQKGEMIPEWNDFHVKYRWAQIQVFSSFVFRRAALDSDPVPLRFGCLRKTLSARLTWSPRPTVIRSR